ncbi:hypothetical protein HY414_02590 [Candidatus Kaiserbacteria bacterium]|nr:hypothetical protein [Candidatus Kaiserbacteria bacterium]
MHTIHTAPAVSVPPLASRPLTNFVYERDMSRLSAPDEETAPSRSARAIHGNLGNTEGVRKAVVSRVDDLEFRIVYGRRQHHRSGKHRKCAPRQWGHNGNRSRE